LSSACSSRRASLALAMLAFKVSNLTTADVKDGYRITAHFDNVGGLKVKAAVTMAGVRIGRVSGIAFDADRYQAVVTMDIDGSTRISPADSTANILTSGLLGDQYIGFEPGGEEAYLKDGDSVLRTQSALVLEKLVGQVIFNKASETEPAQMSTSSRSAHEQNFSTLLFLVLALPVAAGGSEAAPDQIARNATDKIVSLLKANKAEYSRDHKKLYAMVDEQVLTHFDFRAMSRTVLGRHWRAASEEQRARFITEFRELLVRTYATALLKYNDEEIVYLPFRANPDDRTAMVRSEVRRKDGGPPIAIQYGFYRTDNVWKVYDVTIEGASLVSTYQTTYAARVQKEGLDALIASLAQDNKAAATGKTASNGGKTGGKTGATP
jgi:outer membrane lipid asymmetry maintenance protein MlaD